MYLENMGSIGFQFIFTIVLVYGAHTVDTQNHNKQYQIASQPFDAEVKTVYSQDDKSYLPAIKVSNSAKSNILRDLTFSEHSINNSYTDAELVIRQLRSTGGYNTQTGSQSLCHKEGCTCLDQPILTIDCEIFDSVTTLADQYYIPREAKSLNLWLTDRGTTLIINTKQFTNSLLNRVLIRGNLPYGDGREHVEFQNEAFCLNNGTYPELEVYNIHKVVFHRQTFCREFKLNVTNAREVTIMPEAFSVPESEILLNGVKDIRIQEDAFKGSITTMLDIVNSGIKILSELRASFRQIQFTNTTIEQITTKAFDVNKIDSLILKNCEIGLLKSQAITEKLLCKQFIMESCKINAIEKNFIADSGLINFNMQNNIINDIASDAIRFTGILTSIVGNKIIKTGKNWFFQKPDWTSVIIANNSFGEFNYFTIEKSINSKSCQFHGNSITQPAVRSFSFTQHPECTLSETSFNKQCACDESWLKELYYQDYYQLLKESYCRIDETLKFCFNTTTFNVKTYMEQVCNESTRTIDCSRNQKEKKVVPHFVSPNEIESIHYTDYYHQIIIGGVILVLLVIIILSIIFCKLYCKQRVTTSGNAISNTSFTMTTTKHPKVFTPEDKTIIHQTLQKIKDRHSLDLYGDILTHTQKLLGGDFTETEKVLTIGEIVRRLNDCENSGDDFVAFTDILYRHLAPSTNNTPLETIYTEPSCPAEGTTVIESSGTHDHIYAELTSAAQPLLINEYSAPVDHSDSQYSEPVKITQKDNIRTLITPYAIGNNIGSSIQQQQPSTSRNLPDILKSNSGNNTSNTSSGSSSSSSSSNNNNISDAIHCSVSLRYMDRSPNSSREIPEYTLPIKKVPPKPIIHREPIVDSDGSTSSSDHSEHSGGSDITVKIDDIVEYADA
ncbi:uncharacterized protein LOC131440749 [Malaya genurostris]|uniref:uncharacterized protein LOC131440749 n=1 Tax=Malaya genurostris TaxID=325434 RepID=UPI0026F38570|nr:uncharacterized protein LOC131440749 [Malaya genurostris]